MSEISDKQPSVLAETLNYLRNHKITPVCLGIICFFQVLTLGLLGLIVSAIIICVWYAGFADGHVAELEYQMAEIEKNISDLEQLLPKTRVN